MVPLNEYVYVSQIVIIVLVNVSSFENEYLSLYLF